MESKEATPYISIYIYIYKYIWSRKGLQSNDKAMMNATLLKVNYKVKTREGSSSIKPLLTCWYPLMEKV